VHWDGWLTMVYGADSVLIIAVVFGVFFDLTIAVFCGRGCEYVPGGCLRFS